MEPRKSLARESRGAASFICVEQSKEQTSSHSGASTAVARNCSSVLVNLYACFFDSDRSARLCWDVSFHRNNHVSRRAHRSIGPKSKDKSSSEYRPLVKNSRFSSRNRLDRLRSSWSIYQIDFACIKLMIEIQAAAHAV